MNTKNLLKAPLSHDMGQSVLDLLARYGELPKTGCVAGQAVCSALFELYGSNPEHTGPFNDIDIFHTRYDRLLEAGHLDGGIEEEVSWLKNNAVATSEYAHTFEQRLNLGRVLTKGKLNLIELVPSSVIGVDGSKLTPIKKLDTVLCEFDLTPVQVGVDLETGQLRWTGGFEGFTKGEPARAAHIALAERTFVRKERKANLMPWIQWDDEQIQSALHLAQLRTVYAMHQESQFVDLITAWKTRYGAEFESARSGLKPLPIWDWDISDIPDSMHRTIGARMKKGLLDLSDRDAMLAELMARHCTPAKDEEDGLATMIVKGNDAHAKIFSMFSDPTALVSLVGTQEEVMDHLKKNPDCVFKDVPIGSKRLREELLGTAIERDHFEVAAHLMDMGISPNAMTGFVTAYVEAARKYTKPADIENSGILDLLKKMRSHGADLTLPHLKHSTLAHFSLNELPLKILQHEGPAHDSKTWKIRDINGLLPGQSFDGKQERIDQKKARNTEGIKSISDREKLIKKLAPVNLYDAHRARLIKALDAQLDNLNYPKKGSSPDHAGMIQSAKDVLRNSANPNIVMGNDTPLIIDAANRNDTQLIELLLENGADVNFCDSLGKTALMVASRNASVDLMNTLLQAGASVHQTDSGGYTALAHAVLKSHKEAVELLIAHGSRTDLLIPPLGMHMLELSMVCDKPSIPLAILAELGEVDAHRLTPCAIARSEAFNLPKNNVAALQAQSARRAIDRIAALAKFSSATPPQ
jgi:Ankyrin repeats (3 copies)